MRTGDRATSQTRVDLVGEEILDALAHDFCTPLASIKASVSGLRQMDIDWTPEQVRDCLAIIEEETDRLSEIVRQLLDSSRLRSDAIVPAVRPLVLVEIVSQAVAGLGRDAESVVVDVDDRLIVLADAGLLLRVLANLVGNALKHGDGESEVRLAAARRDDRVRLHVVDQGPGIPHAQRERVFQRFAQLDGRTSGAIDGVGLGLAIADGFVRAMDGSIMIDDTPGGGTTMTVELRAGSSTSVDGRKAPTRRPQMLRHLPTH